MARPRTAIVLPVKDGGPLAGEVLAAAARQGADELLVVDSGSTDGTPEVAEAAGFRVLRIPPTEFGHGRTRNLAVRETTADVVCFLTQDATPVDGWLDAYLDAFAEGDDVGMAFGPHLPRPDTSPMVAREQTMFWLPFSPEGLVTVQHRLDEPGWHPEVLSNANAAYRRAALEEVRFREIAYAEDRAFVLDAYAAGWAKAYQPRAAVLHAHDFPFVGAMRRYFDEYRALREVSGHRESLYLQGIARDAWRAAGQDVAWERLRSGESGRATWRLRAIRHHAGRRFAAVAGGRAHRLPQVVQRSLSAERRASTPAPPAADGISATAGPAPAEIPSAAVADRAVRPSPFSTPFWPVAELDRLGDAPTVDVAPGGPWRVGLLLPTLEPARRARQAQALRVLAGLEALGHACSVWVHERRPDLVTDAPDRLRALAAEEGITLAADVHANLGAWSGADVLLPTTWDTALLARRLPKVGRRVVLACDDDTSLLSASIERAWARRAYREAEHVVCLGGLAADRITRLRDVRPAAAPRGLDRSLFHAEGDARRGDTLLVHLDPSSADSAMHLAVLAATELVRRRPDLRVVTFGTPLSVGVPFASRHARAPGAGERAALFREATVGLAPTISGGSDVPAEMAACGLPPAPVWADGEDGVPGDVLPVVDELERLLDVPEARRERVDQVAATDPGRPWPEVAAAVERELREVVATG